MGLGPGSWFLILKFPRGVTQFCRIPRSESFFSLEFLWSSDKSKIFRPPSRQFKSFKFGSRRRMSDEKFIILEFKYLQDKKWQKQAVKSTRIRKSYQFTVNHRNTSIFNIQFSKLYLATSIGIVSYKRLYFLLKEVGLVLVRTLPQSYLRHCL